MSFEVKSIAVFERQAKRLIKKYPSLKSELLTLILKLKELPDQGAPLARACATFNPVSQVIWEKSGDINGNVTSGAPSNITFLSSYAFSKYGIGLEYKNLFVADDPIGFLDGSYLSDDYELSFGLGFGVIKLNWGSGGNSFFMALA